MLLFLLHPRLYAESFVNTKDLPLAAMFMVALFLTHRAFRKDTVGAFLLCGLAVGILINIRILGVVLFAAVPAVRALDLLFDSGERGRKHALITGGVFALAAMFVLYATLPYLWASPIERTVEMFVTLSHYPTVFPQLFQGELIIGDDLPPHYIPTWDRHYDPAGRAPAGRCRNNRHPPARLGQSPEPPAPRRLEIWLPANRLPAYDLGRVVVVTSLNVQRLATDLLSLPRLFAPWPRSGCIGWPRSRAHGSSARRCTPLVGAGILLVVLQMVRIHPYQQGLFQFPGGPETPGRLGDQYPVEYWGTSYLDGLRWLTETYPDFLIQVRAINNHDYRNRAFLPESDRQRIALNPAKERPSPIST